MVGNGLIVRAGRMKNNCAVTGGSIDVNRIQAGPLFGQGFDVRRHIQRTYLDVATAYLGWRRIQEQRPDDWLPPEGRFDPALLGELGHFYSDYQQPVRALQRIRRTIDLLHTLDPRQAPEAYRQVMERLMNQAPEADSAQRVLETLTAPRTSPPVS